MDYNSISLKPFIKSHFELKREITLIELAPSPYFFVQSVGITYKETKRYGRKHRGTGTRTDGWTLGQRENSLPTTNKVCGGIIKILMTNCSLMKVESIAECSP